MFQMRVQKQTVVFVKSKHSNTLKSSFKLDFGCIFRVRSLLIQVGFTELRNCYVNTDKVAL